MNFKAGDKVLFLNEKGGGIVTRVVDEHIVHVAIEDGFEIPYAVTDILKVSHEETDQQRLVTGRSVSATHPGKTTQSLHVLPHQTEEEGSGIYLAMVPRNQDQPLAGAMDFYLLNHTIYDGLFGIFLNQSGNYKGHQSGVLPPGSKISLGKVERNEIEDWGHGLLQMVFFKEGKTSTLPPASEHIIFKPVKIYKEESFAFNSMIRQKAYVFMVVDAMKTERGQEKPADVSEAIKHRILSEGKESGQGKSKVTQKSFLEKYLVSEDTAEIDLHIQSLTDSTLNMDHSDMLQLQLDYVKQCLDEALRTKILKMVFIHGVGQGRLKTALLGLLAKTPAIEYYDAPYARYGMGATEVLFYRHRK